MDKSPFSSQRPVLLAAGKHNPIMLGLRYHIATEFIPRPESLSEPLKKLFLKYKFLGPWGFCFVKTGVGPRDLSFRTNPQGLPGV